MKNVKFRGKKMNSAAKFRDSIPWQKPKFRGAARNSAGRGKLCALHIWLLVKHLLRISQELLTW